MLTDEQLRNRSRGIGGSDAAACVGESKWSTSRQLWHKKRNHTMAREMNEPMRWGHLIESVILDEYERRTGFPLTRDVNTLRHPEHEWMLANIDAWAAEQSIVVDAKNCRSSDGWGRPGTDEVPPDYWWQAQHYMAVIGCDQADIVVLFAGQDFQIYTVWADQESQDNLIELERRLWQHVLDGTMPDAVDADDVLLIHPESTGTWVDVDADDEIAELIAELRDARKRAKSAEISLEYAELRVKEAIGSADGLRINGKVAATWKSAKPSEKFDAGRLMYEQPDLYKQYTRTVPGSRRFLLKGER